MRIKDEYSILKEHVKEKGLRITPQREVVLDAFLGTERHVDVESLYILVKKRDASISFATVYRTLKLLCECELAKELKFEGKITRYEHKYNHKHHDHLVCAQCGKIVEFHNDKIEEIQDKVARENNFKVLNHHLEINGICSSCRN
ncbi:MAG: transcriptional repressor [bacterium]|nr:transcriptional repressor [bacterium]